jgi:hypothetical protein
MKYPLSQNGSASGNRQKLNKRHSQDQSPLALCTTHISVPLSRIVSGMISRFPNDFFGCLVCRDAHGPFARKMRPPDPLQDDETMPRLFDPIHPVPDNIFLDLGLFADAAIRLPIQGKTITADHSLKPDESTACHRDHALARFPERAEGVGS